MMLYGWQWLFLITVTSTLHGILAFRADLRTIRTSYVCENGVMHLQCGPSNVLEIHGADYGGDAAFICGNGQGSDQACSLVDKTQTVKLRCDNKPICTIVALSSIFGEICPGLIKYLNVMYACVQPIDGAIIPTTTSAPTSENDITEGTATTNRSTSVVNLTTNANITQPPSTATTTSTPNKPNQLTTRPSEEGPKTKRVIPVFDPSNSVMLEAISDSAHVKSFCGVGLLSCACILILVVVWWL